jgi:hypothetical protein
VAELLNFLELEQKLTNNPLEGFTNPPKDMGALETAAYELAIERHLVPRKKNIEWAQDDPYVVALFQHAHPDAVAQLKSAFGTEDGHFLEIPKDYDYSVHLNIVHHLLKAAGIKDDVMLAAAFSHDMMEDCKDDNGHKFRPDTLAASLKTKLTELSRSDEQFKDVAVSNDKINKMVALVEHVTNPSLMPEGKRFYQVNKMRKSGEMEKQLKIADQAASIIEDAMVNSALKPEKLKIFLAKARDVVVACEDESHPNRVLRAIEDVAFRYATQILNIPLNYQVKGDEIQTKKLQLTMAREFRDAFHLEETISVAQKDAHTLGLSDRRIFPDTEVQESWGVGVGVMVENGHVQGIRIHAPKAMKSTMLMQSQQLVEALESFGNAGVDARTRIKSRMIHESRRPCVELRLSPPLMVGDVASVLESLEAEWRKQHGDQQKDKQQQNKSDYRGISFSRSCSRLRQMQHASKNTSFADGDVVHKQVPHSPWGARIIEAAKKQNGGAFDERDDISR